MARGQYMVATHYAVTAEKYAVAEKYYWTKQTAVAHYQATMLRDGINALVLYDPNGTIIRSWNKARETK